MTIPDLIQLISNVIISGVTFFGAFYVVRQVEEARKAVHEAQKARVEAQKARVLEPFLKMAERIDGQRADRRQLYEWKGPINEDWIAIFERVSTTFDLIGILVREDILYRPIVLKLYYDVIIKTWDCVRVQVLSQRDTLKSKTYMADLEYLYNEAVKYQERNFLPRPCVDRRTFSVELQKIAEKPGIGTGEQKTSEP